MVVEVDEAMATVGVTVVFTVIATVLLVGAVGLAHAALLVITQLTTSEFASVVVVNVVLFVPELLPFTFHW